MTMHGIQNGREIIALAKALEALNATTLLLKQMLLCAAMKEKMRSNMSICICISVYTCMYIYIYAFPFNYTLKITKLARSKGRMAYVAGGETVVKPFRTRVVAAARNGFYASIIELCFSWVSIFSIHFYTFSLNVK